MYTGLMPQEEMLEIGKKHKKLVIGMPKEDPGSERRISLTPEAVEVLVDNGHEVVVETKAGDAAHYTDKDYSEHGAFIEESRKKVFESEVILKVAPLTEEEIQLLKTNQVVFSSLHLSQQSQEYIRGLMAKKVTAIAYEYLKDGFGSFPVLKSMSAISGNAAIMIAAELLSNQSGGKGIILGGISGITPTEVVIIGAGTAAEYAARAAIGMGAFVKVFDTSVQRLDELQRNLGMRLHTSIFHPQVLMRTLKSADVLIGAVSLQDQGPRFFVTEEMVRDMKRGSIIIDLNVDQGGCIETSECRTLKEPTYTKHDVIHYSVPNVPSRVARTASIALSNIISPIVLEVGTTGGMKPFLKDQNGVRNGVYIYRGILTNELIGNRFGIPSKDIELLMAAF
ncbi:MAG: alanine dehydrogenase [Bacteroidales bacterium]|nr:alanine dehydrogenase [Bacteroidales bacterium]